MLPVSQRNPLIRQRLEILEDVGLDYIQLGQPATTLSGGEAQRVRLQKNSGKDQQAIRFICLTNLQQDCTLPISRNSLMS